MLLPFLGAGYLNLFAAFTYMVFSLVLMLMMMQCAQVSRDRGINPVFIYAFFGAVVYLMQAVGFLLGWVSDFVSVDGFDWLFFVAMVSATCWASRCWCPRARCSRPWRRRGR
ncbi:MAG: hypothetical protein V8S24_16380 [Gordonibacter pamelaeae]